MSRSAARATDFHICPLRVPTSHLGGPILPPGATTMLIEGLPAARVDDRAVCIAPAADTIRGGLLSVFIEGSPAARILDKTDVGYIITGSPTVKLGEWGGGPLSPYQAQWLYDYMSRQQQIPFEYATDGCFARADRMAEYMQSLNIDVQKQWVAATSASGPLRVPIANYPGGGVTWGWHVAPVVQVTQPTGGSATMVIDPSLQPGGPVSVDEWVSIQSTSPDATARTTTPVDAYFNPYDENTDSWRPMGGTPVQTADHLDYYRDLRANLPSSSGRNVPNAPVHY